MQREPLAPDAGHLKILKGEKLREFYAAETRTSGESDARLADSSGPENALLGIILHVQSEDDTIGEFWDMRSATIGLIEEKGIDPDFAFGYDWHWRANDSFHSSQRPGCPAARWRRELRALHDQMSMDILHLLPLPFVITGSSCVRESIRKNFHENLIPLEIPLKTGIIPEAATLRLDIEYRLDTIQRIFCHVHHPSAGFFATKDIRASMALQIDAGMNFFLWLIGRRYDGNTFGRHYKFAAPRANKAAPLPEMWAYVRKERETGRSLTLQEYSPSFLTWARRFLGDTFPSGVLPVGESVADRIATEIRRRLSLAATERYCRRKENLLVNELEIVAPVDEILTTSVAAEKRPELTETDLALYGERQMKKKYVQDDIGTQLLTLHGSQVTIMRSGFVKLQTHNSHQLKFRLANKTAKEILKLGETLRIFFSVRELSILVNENVVYQKPIERLLASAEGPAWFSQIMHEINGIKNSKTGPRNTQETAIHDIQRIEHHAGLGSGWKKGELRRKLLEGDLFHCGRGNINGRLYGRVSFRGIQIWIPEEADAASVWIHCFMVPMGSQHPSQCCNTGPLDDPCRRLGVKIRYVVATNRSEKEQWITWKGEKSAKKLNSLVDFLEHRNDIWTESQPRRFLDRNLSRGRKNIMYT